MSLAGLVPVMRLAQEVGLYEQVAQRVRLQETSIDSDAARKVAAIVAGMGAPGRTRSMIWTCCARAGWTSCSVRGMRPRY